jgi:hypothetical protein
MSPPNSVASQLDLRRLEPPSSAFMASDLVLQKAYSMALNLRVGTPAQ